MFDTLKYAKVLEGVGFSRAQAEVQVQMISDVMAATLATKQDLKDLGGSLRAELASVREELKTEISNVREELKADIASVREELKADIANVREELKADINGVRQELRLEIKDVRNEIREVEYRLTIKLGTIVSVAIGVAVALTKLIE
jgi:molecular chaperone DnaK (HSP70)